MGNELDAILPGYNQIHDTWKGLLDTVKDKELHIILENAFEREAAMEIGIGNGALTCKLARNFKKVYAVDASQAVLDYVNNQNYDGDICFMKGYIEDLSFRNKVDNIILSHILEHIDDPVEALRNVKKLMHPNTVLYINVPNSMSLHRQVGVEMGLLGGTKCLNAGDISIGNKRVYDIDELTEHISEAGLKIVKTGGILLKPISNSQIEKVWSREMIEGFMRLGDKYPELCGDIFAIAKSGE